MFAAASAHASFEDGLKAYNSGNFAVAAQDWRQDAQTGDPRAQFRLGQMYEQGRGVVQNRVQAHLWYNLAAAQGNEEAAQARDRLAKTMTPDQQAEAERLALAWKPIVSTASSVPAAPTASTPHDLYKAAEAGDVTKIRDLLSHGSNMNEPDGDGWTAIFYAAAKGQTEAVKALIDAKANVNAKGKRDGETPLMVAALSGYVDVVKALLVAGADKNAKDSKGRTAAQMAEAKQESTILAVLGPTKSVGQAATGAAHPAGITSQRIPPSGTKDRPEDGITGIWSITGEETAILRGYRGGIEVHLPFCGIRTRGTMRIHGSGDGMRYTAQKTEVDCHEGGTRRADESKTQEGTVSVAGNIVSFNENNVVYSNGAPPPVYPIPPERFERRGNTMQRLGECKPGPFEVSCTRTLIMERQ
jgi:hypothetical protein